MDVLLVIDMQQGLFDNPRHQDAQVIANINRLADRVRGQHGREPRHLRCSNPR